MKKTIYAALVLAMAMIISAGGAYAGNGSGTCTQAGTGLYQTILDGEPFLYEGTVVSIGSGLGMEIATADSSVIIYGIGPVRYWESLGVDRPAVGDAVTVEGFAVDYSGTVRNIAMTITVNGIEVQLRDLDTAQPLWVSYQKGRK